MRDDVEDRWLMLSESLSPVLDGVLKDVGEDGLRTAARWRINR